MTSRRPVRSLMPLATSSASGRPARRARSPGRRRWPSIPRPWACGSAAILCAWCSSAAGDGDAHLVQLDRATYDAPNLKRLLTDPGVLKIFHFGRFDIAMFPLHLGVVTAPGLLHQDRLQAGAHLHRPPWAEGRHRASSSASTSPRRSRVPTGARRQLTPDQQAYAASDVLHLHALKAKLDAMLAREGRDGPGPGLLRLPAPPRPAGRGRLGGRRHLRP